MLAIALTWMERMTEATFGYRIQYHADQDVETLRSYWAGQLDIEPAFISVQRKSNSNHLTGRTWRSPYGVLTIQSNDTLFRARLQAWIDRLREQWLDSTPAGA